MSNVPSDPYTLPHNNGFDITKPICTRDGRKAYITAVFAASTHGPYILRGKVENPCQKDTYIALSFTAEGRLKIGDNKSCHDLINKQIWHDWLRS